MGNVLVFEENYDFCAKWTDFGLGYVYKGQWAYRKINDPEMDKKIETDVVSLHSIFWNCWRGRKMDQESTDEKWLGDQFMEMNKTLKSVRNLDIVYRNYKHILDENLPLTREALI